MNRRSFLRISAGAGIVTAVTVGAVAYKFESGRDYFVSASGNDSNSGVTRDDPWQSIARINNAIADGTILSGDTIKFRRGDEFFGNIRTERPAGQPPSRLGITGYGSGARPIISAYKVVDRADAWTPVAPRIWRVDLVDTAKLGGNTENRSGNVGFLRVDGSIEGSKKWGIHELRLEWDFYSDGRHLFVYLPENPTSATEDLRIAVDGPIIGATSDLLIAGLDIVGSGGSGYQQNGAYNTEIVDCFIHEIGGAELAAGRRYGNAIDLAMGASSAHVRSSDIFDVYDTAYSVTDGIHGSVVAASSCTFEYNRVWNTARVFRYGAYGPVRSPEGASIGCSVNSNFCMNTGRPWGSSTVPVQPGIGSVILIDGQHPAGIDFSRNTIFNAYDSYIATPAGGHDKLSGYTMDHNVIVLRPQTRIQFPGRYTVDNAHAWAAATGQDSNSEWFQTLAFFPSPHDAMKYVARHSDTAEDRHRLLTSNRSGRTCAY